MPYPQGDILLTVTPEENSLRFDALLSQRIGELSRSQAATLIRQGDFRIDDQPRKPSYRVRPGEQVVGRIPEAEPVDLAPEAIPLTVLFEDASLIVIDKPAGLVVHPAAGHPTGTLVNALLHHCPDLEGIGGEKRPGIVHRLDKDTSGLIVVAKNDLAHQALSLQFKARQVFKQYLALVHGEPIEEKGIISMPLGRHQTERKKMAVVTHGGREAITEWAVEERLAGTSLLVVTLKTGRTHQIRVHCLHMGHPLVGDPVYGRRRQARQIAQADAAMHRILKSAGRQMLHAARLRFSHPVSGAPLSFEADLPEDMASLLASLRQLAKV